VTPTIEDKNLLKPQNEKPEDKTEDFAETLRKV
jgi:hypothetical protein